MDKQKCSGRMGMPKRIPIRNRNLQTEITVFLCACTLLLLHRSVVFKIFLSIFFLTSTELSSTTRNVLCQFVTNIIFLLIDVFHYLFVFCFFSRHLERYNYSPQKLERALKAISEGSGISSISNQFNIPKTSLIQKSNGKTTNLK